LSGGWAARIRGFYGTTASHSRGLGFYRGRAAADRGSFIDALRQLAVRLIDLCGVDKLLLVPLRPGRHEPRVIRRRMKEYDLLTQLRSVRKQQEKQREEA
jgi:hypothetical protein